MSATVNPCGQPFKPQVTGVLGGTIMMVEAGAGATLDSVGRKISIAAALNQRSSMHTPTDTSFTTLDAIAASQEGPSGFRVGNFSIDEYRPIKVVVVGAGFSGILAGIRFPQKIPGIDLTIYEKSAGVGGVWYSHKYPGVACDIPAFCYQYSFEDKRDWSSFYAPGREIQQHLQEVVDKYKVSKYLKLQHEVIHAAYDEPSGKWHLRIRRANLNGDGYEVIEDHADVLVNALGTLGRWKLPEIDGIADFRGELYHTAQFDPPDGSWETVAERWKNKKVGVIGVGSSAVQVVTALQPRVAKIVNFGRGQTWLSPPVAADMLPTLLGREEGIAGGNVFFSAEERERFQRDPSYFRSIRHALEDRSNSLHSVTQKGSQLQSMLHALFKDVMEKKLAAKPWIAETLIPGFSVGCRRVSPGLDYLDALCADNVDFVSSPIDAFTDTGVKTQDGAHHNLDLLFCATGYDTSWKLPLDIVGRNGVKLNDKWKDYPTSYLSICVDDFPNMFMCLGPNAFFGTGSLIPMIEATIMYAVQATAKMQRERLKSIEVRREAVRDFQEYLESYFEKTVFNEQCRSWYKMGKADGPIVGLWPGSTLHAVKALQHPRWEDFQYEQIDIGVRNRFYWLGDGQSYSQKTLTGDKAWYLREDCIDRPPGELCQPSRVNAMPSRIDSSSRV
ncbi:FAD/NAD-P-binding domain-containing protein [Cerioporus squamosus]|nr:FAD/NAD-P-binding domain-containing protein [Cerioporus squamosus]